MLCSAATTMILAEPDEPDTDEQFADAPLSGAVIFWSYLMCWYPRSAEYSKLISPSR